MSNRQLDVGLDVRARPQLPRACRRPENRSLPARHRTYRPEAGFSLAALAAADLLDDLEGTRCDRSGSAQCSPPPSDDRLYCCSPS